MIFIFPPLRWRARVPAHARVHASRAMTGRRPRAVTMVSTVLVATCALALALAATPVRAQYGNVYNPYSTYYGTPGYTGPTTANSMACTTDGATKITKFGPDFGTACASSSSVSVCSGAASAPTGCCDRDAAGGGGACNQYTWEYETYKYWVRDERPNLPKPFTGIPRVDIKTNKEYKGQMAITDSYIGSIIGQALPGLVIAILLLLSMILVLVFYILSSCCKCCGLCNCCFRPAPYTRKSLHIAKGIQLVFVVLAACGCFVIFAGSPGVHDGVSLLTSGLLNASVALQDDVKILANAVGSRLGTEVTDLQNAADTVTSAIKSTNKAIDRAKDQVQLGADIVSGVLLGIAVLTMILSILNFWRILILFSILTSLILIITWIVVGALAAVGVFLDDFCYSVDRYVEDPQQIDLSKDIPCAKEKDVIEFGNAFRQLIATVTDEMNKAIDASYSGNPGPGYICMPYEMQTLDDLCGTSAALQAGTFRGPLWNDEYANYVCKAYHQAKLPSGTTAFPSWGCLTSPACGTGYTNGTVLTRSAACMFKKDLATVDTNTYPNLASDSTFTSNLADVQALNNAIPTLESLLKCDFIRNTFIAISPGCGATVDALQMVWRGFIVTAVGYLCLWICMLVTLGRMSNADLMIDGGRFNAKKAGLV